MTTPRVLGYDEFPLFAIPGIRHQTLAGPAQGLRQMEIWEQTVEPGGETPPHRHDCEEVVVVLSGSGRCEYADQRVDFQAPTVLIVPPDAVHKISNTGATPMRVIAALSMAPVQVQTPTGEPIALPWGAAASDTASVEA